MASIATMGRQQGISRAFLTFIVLLLCLAFIVYILIDIKIRPMIATYGNNQATTTATKAVNDAVEITLSDLDLKYEDFATVNKDSNGKVLSIYSNTENINLLKSTVSNKILEELNKQGYQMVKIPLGSLFGGLLTGRGPDITIKVPMNSTVQTAFQNKFEGAGINQTRHEISLDVKVTTYAVIQGENTAVDVDTNFEIAENILVGEVPNWMVGTQTSD